MVLAANVRYISGHSLTLMRLKRHRPWWRLSWQQLPLGLKLHKGLRLDDTLRFMADKRASPVSKLKRKRLSKEDSFSEHHRSVDQTKDPEVMTDHDDWGQYAKL